MPKTAVSTSCTAMNGPYPPVLPPKPPNIGVARTVCVTSTESPKQTKSDERVPGKPPQPTKTADTVSSKVSRESRQTGLNSRISAFAESIESPRTRVASKHEPRIEPSGIAYGGRQQGQVNPEIGIISFLCEYPRASLQSLGSKKNIFQNLLLRSNSKRRLTPGLMEKLPAATAARKTSEGRRYSQIVIKGLYEGGENKSAYQVNVVDRPSKASAKSGSKTKRLKNEVVKPVKKREPIESLSEAGEGVVVTSDEMADSISKNLNDSQAKQEELQRERNGEKPKSESSPTLMLPLHRAAESTFGVDFSSILARHEQGSSSPKKSMRASFSTLRMNRSESRPVIRDFAGERSTTLLSAFRQRSKSPVKNKAGKDDAVSQSPSKQSPSKQSPMRMSNKQMHVKNNLPTSPPITQEVPDLAVYTQRINSIRDSVAQHAGLAALVPLVDKEPSRQKLWITTDDPKQANSSGSQQSSGQSFNTKNSSTSKGHSKSPSGISAGSNDNDNLSEVSSAIISDAQSISIHKPNGDADWGNGILTRKPIRPGPAPTGPLPSLPEGHDVQLPSTPRRSESSQRKSSPERSPTKSRQKAPVKYRLTPAEGSPASKPVSPVRVNTTSKAEQIARRPAAVVRIQTANVDAFPSPPLSSPDTKKRQNTAVGLLEKPSTSVGTPDARAERIQKLKAKDLAQERLQSALLADSNCVLRPSERSSSVTRREDEQQKDSIERLIDSYDTEQAPFWHKPQLSVQSTLSASTTNHRNSIRSSDFSPIIIVADQEPVTVPKPLSVESPSSEYTNGIVKASAEMERISHPLADEAVQQRGSRPASVYSLQAPHPPDKSPRRSTINRSPHKSVVNRAPTPFTHPSLLRKDSHRSSKRSSLTERDLEVRMAAMERKNRWLERAFHAVMDVSASMSSGDENHGRDSRLSFGIDNRFSGFANDSLDQYGTDAVAPDTYAERIHAGLETALARQGHGRMRTLSTSSEPC